MSSVVGYQDDLVIGAWLHFSAALAAVVLALAVLRVYVARLVVRGWSKDDTFMLLALSFAFVSGAVQALGAKYAQDVMSGRQPIGNVFYYAKVQGMVGVPSYALATALAKCAIVFYLVRLAVSRHIRMVAYAAMVLAIGQCLAVSVSMFACAGSLNDAGSLLLSQANPEGYPTCAKTGLVWVITAFINSFTDLILLVLPLWILKPLRARWQKKLAITGVLMGGGFVFGVSIFRAYQAFGLASQGEMYMYWTTGSLWCVVELLFGLICACFPATKALYNHIRGPDRSSCSLRTVRLRTLTQPATAGVSSNIAHGGGGVVRLGSSDGTTAVCTKAYTTASPATAVDTATTTATTTTTTATAAEHSHWHCSDVTLTPPSRAHVPAENGCSACGGECGEYEASCLASARLSLSTTVEDEPAVQHDAMWGGEGANGPRRFAMAPYQAIKKTRW